MNNGKHGESVKFEDWFGDLEKAQLGDGMVKFEDYSHHLDYVMEGDFNWKTLMDGYRGFCKSRIWWRSTVSGTNSCHFGRVGPSLLRALSCSAALTPIRDLLL